jgi:nitrite reductase/ring-hydroxylating ferredoxin subunit
MTAKSSTPAPICASAALPELGKYAFTVDCRGGRHPVIAIRFRGAVHGYLNQCVHTPRPLDCEEPDIFDESGQYLRCSVHGVLYDPVSGESVGGMCAGKKLTALKVEERGGVVYLADKRAERVAGS